MKRIRLTEQQLKSLVEQALNEINGENKEAIASLKINGKYRGFRLNGLNDEIAHKLFDNLKWDAGVEASATVELNYPIKDNLEAYVEVDVFVDFDKKGRYNIDIQQIEGFIVDNDGRYVPHSQVLIDEDVVGKKVLQYMPSEAELQKEFTHESLVRGVAESIKRSVLLPKRPHQGKINHRVLRRR